MTSSLAFGPALVVMIAATFVLAATGERRYGYGITHRGNGDPRIAYFASCRGGHAAIAFADKQFVPVWRRWKYTPITQTTVANAADSSGGDTACQRLDYRW